MLVCPVLFVALVTRPRAEEWPVAVERMRRLQRAGAGSFSTALQPAREAFDSPKRWSALAALASNRLAFGFKEWPEAKLWAADVGVISIGCTHKRCFVGVAGSWHRVPGPKADLYALVAMHGSALAVRYQYGPTAFFRHFSPRLSDPHTLLLGGFATSGEFEMLWLGSTLLGLGHELQRSIGRGGFLVLWLGGATSVSLVAATQRISSSGAGGALASFAYHALAAPFARHNIFGIEMGPKAALSAQAILATWSAFNGDAPRPAAILALHGLPILLGSLLWQSGALK